MRISSKVANTLAAMAQLAGKQLSKQAADMLAFDLARFPEQSVLMALQRCRLELPRFPTTADILARLEDGHPGPEEAWAMLPKHEDDSAVWTSEISQAYGVVSGLLHDGNEIEARMAFKEVYSKLLSEARAMNRAPKWRVSLGHNPRTREAALREAVEKKRITMAEARQHLPEFGLASFTPPVKQIAGTVSQMDAVPAPADFKALMEKIRGESEARKAGLETELYGQFAGTTKKEDENAEERTNPEPKAP